MANTHLKYDFPISLDTMGFFMKRFACKDVTGPFVVIPGSTCYTLRQDFLLKRCKRKCRGNIGMAVLFLVRAFLI